MTRLRPHQRPILTRFAFVMPVRKLGDVVVPCEPHEAEVFRLIVYRPKTAEFEIKETFSDYELARKEAEALHRSVASCSGVEQ